jgi:hypothetical protein
LKNILRDARIALSTVTGGKTGTTLAPDGAPPGYITRITAESVHDIGVRDKDSCLDTDFV